MNTIGLINLILLVVFVTMKLLGLISWSWWTVTAPFWVPFAFVTMCFLLVVIDTLADEGGR